MEGTAVETERKEGGDGGIVATLELFPVAAKRIEGSCEGVCLDSLVPLEDSWVAIMDEAILAEANRHPFVVISSLGFATQYGSLKVMKGSSNSEARVCGPSEGCGLEWHGRGGGVCVPSQRFCQVLQLFGDANFGLQKGN